MMFGFNAFAELFPDPDVPRTFNSIYRCYSIAMSPGHARPELENGGKILLPPSALEHLNRLNVAYPMMFKLSNIVDGRSTHCGVLEFVADEGNMYVPSWMMRNLAIEEGALIIIESATLPVATFSMFEPQSVDFLDITSPKAFLENALRNFACLTTGDIVAIRYNDKVYELRVLETRPGPAVNIIECDMNVDFAPPVGYVEPETKAQESQEPVSDGTFVPFQGLGNRINGKSVSASAIVAAQSSGARRGAPDFGFRIGQLNFARNIKTATNEDANDDKPFTPFGGLGSVLKPKLSNS